MAAISILKALELLAAREPDKAILIEDERVVTRREFDANTNRLARAFAAQGVCQGDFVSIILPNSIAFLETVAAVWKLGAVPQPLPAKLAAMELNEIIALAKPKLIVGQPPTTPDNCAVIPRGFSPDPALSAAPLPDVVAPHFKAMVSGGSTGRPKIIVAGNPGMIDLEAPLPTIKPNERFLLTGPLYHNAPFLAATMTILTGGCAIVMDRFDAETMLRLTAHHRVQFLSLVPTMMLRVWKLPQAVRDKYDLSSLRAMSHGSAPCPSWLKEAWIDWLGPDRVLEAYSSTEAPGYTIINGREWLQRRGSVGKPDPAGCQVKICDPQGRELQAGQVGEVFMRPTPGPDSTYYFGRKYRYIGAESRSLDGGWDSMGDQGYVDQDGYLYLCDRSADVIIRGGANIYPAEIEAALDSHPMIRSSVVVGVPDDDLGEAILAIVDTSASISVDELNTYLRRQLSPYKIPQRYDFVRSSLRDDAGKVRRAAIRQTYVEAAANAA